MLLFVNMSSIITEYYKSKQVSLRKKLRSDQSTAHKKTSIPIKSTQWWQSKMTGNYWY